MATVISSNYTVSSSVTLSGFTSPSQFTPTVANAFASATAAQFNLPATAVFVNVSGITVVNTRRRLHATSLSVPFTIAVTNASAANGVSTGLANIPPASFASTLSSTLATAGVTGITVSVTSFAPPTVVLPPASPVNFTSAGTNVSAAVASVTSQLAGSSGAALAAAQTSVLASLATSTALSSAAASTAASMVLAVVTASPNATLSPEVQSQALSVLGTVTANTTSLSASAASTVAAGVLAVVSASTSASMTPAVQTAALSVLGAVSFNTSALSSSVATTVAAGVLAVVNGSATVGASTQTNALAVLSSVVSVPINTSGSTGGSVVNALSAIASSAAANNPAALAQVTAITNNLATNAASSLLQAAASGNSSGSAPMSATVTFASPNIQMAVSVTPPGAATSAAAISAPGSPSSFDAVSPSLLAAAASGNTIVTQFQSLAFDPHAGNGTGNGTAAAAGSLNTVGGVTRLEFSTATGTLAVANATTPITFTLPLVTPQSMCPFYNTTTGAYSNSSCQGQCSFWDTAAQAYSTAGCIGVPNPSPPNHTLAFIPGYQTPDDASLAMAWNITGPLMAGCNTTLIDCSLPNPPVIYPDPRQPLAVPAVSCPASATSPPVLRVFYGTHCALWQTGNGWNCSWDNLKQAFVGAGCVPAGNTTRCMCRHLTDFAAARAPVLTTCSLSDLLSLNPADIVTKLRVLFIVRSFHVPRDSLLGALTFPHMRVLS